MASRFTWVCGLGVLAMLSVSRVVPAFAQDGIDPTKDIGIDQRLNEQVPLNLSFKDETGKVVTLKDYVGTHKPLVLMLPFYKCTGSCLLEMNGLIDVVRKMPLVPGKDYTVVTVSINPKETPEIALAKKREAMEGVGKPGAETGWSFLTGTQDNIQALAKAVGFRYGFDLANERFSHATGVMVVTPEGKLSRYLYGDTYDPKVLKLSLVEASDNKIGSLSDKIVLYCSQYDPRTSKYGVQVMKLIQLGGIVTIGMLGGFIVIMLRREKKGLLTQKPA